jgi:hypothetical protein
LEEPKLSHAVSSPLSHPSQNCGSQGTSEGDGLADSLADGDSDALGLTDGDSLALGDRDGDSDGEILGLTEGDSDGLSDGDSLADGDKDGLSDGLTEGDSEAEGDKDGLSLGLSLGLTDGLSLADGDRLGLSLGDSDGDSDADGDTDGDTDGDSLGDSDGLSLGDSLGDSLGLSEGETDAEGPPTSLKLAATQFQFSSSVVCAQVSVPLPERYAALDMSAPWSISAPISLPAEILRFAGVASVMQVAPTVIEPAIAPATVIVGSELEPVLVLVSWVGSVRSTPIRSMTWHPASVVLALYVTSTFAVTPPRSDP